MVLRRSLQYALASKTLTVIAVLPAIALALSLVRDRSRTLGDIFMGSAGLYIVLIVVSVAAFRYRERARQWLDLRFFREEYDARKILLSLASRVRFETDPADLAAMVVSQIDEALHPNMVAILVGGLEDGLLVPVTVLHGSADSLPLDGGLGGMLRWSDAPLDILLHDPEVTRPSSSTRGTRVAALHRCGAARARRCAGGWPRRRDRARRTPLRGSLHGRGP